MYEKPSLVTCFFYNPYSSYDLLKYANQVSNNLVPLPYSLSTWDKSQIEWKASVLIKYMPLNKLSIN